MERFPAPAAPEKSELVARGEQIVAEMETYNTEAASADDRVAFKALHQELHAIMMDPRLTTRADYGSLPWSPRFAEKKQQTLAANENHAPKEERSSIPPDPTTKAGKAIIDEMGYPYVPAKDGVSKAA